MSSPPISCTRLSHVTRAVGAGAAWVLVCRRRLMKMASIHLLHCGVQDASLTPLTSNPSEALHTLHATHTKGNLATSIRGRGWYSTRAICYGVYLQRFYHVCSSELSNCHPSRYKGVPFLGRLANDSVLRRCFSGQQTRTHSPRVLGASPESQHEVLLLMPLPSPFGPLLRPGDIDLCPFPPCRHRRSVDFGFAKCLGFISALPSPYTWCTY